MSIKEIPERVVGPGSKPRAQADAPLYIDMPGDMARYSAPLMPEPDAVKDLAGAREATEWLRRALETYSQSSAPQLANLNPLDAANRDLINQILGEGEVSVTYEGELSARTQEAVLAGVWRTLYTDPDEQIALDMLEVAAIPHIVRVENTEQSAIDTSSAGTNGEFANAMPILVELAASCEQFERDRTPHSINLTLLPLSDEEVEYIDSRLGRGPVDILSRAYGKCQVISTLTPNVWWVRYYNSMGTLILNTLEVVDVPQVVAAAPEDIADSASRLQEILAPYWTDEA